MTDRPTPETDLIEQGMFGSDPKLIADFARRLERERDEAREQLAAERALADKLADSLTACERWVNQPCDVKTEANKVLMIWKEARNGPER